MRLLKESWKDAPQAIEELEKEGDVLVTRTVKDGQMRLVFWNEVRPDEEGAGKAVEKGTPFFLAGLFNTKHCLEFQDLWHTLTVPEEADLLKSLASGAPFLGHTESLFLVLLFRGDASHSS